MSHVQVRVFDTDLFLLAKGSSGIETAFGSSSAIVCSTKNPETLGEYTGDLTTA